MMTGYYGIPGKGHGGKVHLHINSGPACGAHISKQAEFQWCAAGIEVSYIECKSCLRIAKKILREEYLQKVAMLKKKINAIR